MGVPKRRTSKAKTRSRRAHHALPKMQLITCENCGAKRLPHRVCPECGYYKKSPVMSPKKGE